MLLTFILTASTLSHAATQSITLTASDSDGTNTGTGRLGMPVTMTTATALSTYPVRTWSLSGAGSLASNSTNNMNATYTPPTVMPANTTVQITVTLPGNPPSYPAVSTTYTLTLINPMPKITAVGSGNLTAGAATSVTLIGSGFVPSTGLTTSMGTAKATYVSPTSLTALVTLPAGVSGNVSLKPQNTTPGGGTGAAVAVPILSVQMTASTSDGTNTGTVRLGKWINFSTSVLNSPYLVRDWTLTGPGTLQTNGANNAVATYTPPSAMPSNPNVTITIHLDGDSTAATSYSFSIVNPVPLVNSGGVSPTTLLTGATQNLAIGGSGFIPGTVAVVNGVKLPTTVSSFYQLTLPVPVPANASGNLTFQMYNPGPGGGYGTTFTVAVPTNSIRLSATGMAGSTTAGLGTAVDFSAVVTGSAQTAVNWTVTGAGTVSSGGVYTAPAAMPASTAVTVKATLASNTAISSSSSFTLVNAVPNITATNVYQIPAGATTAISLTGTGFVSKSIILVNGVAATTFYVSPTKLIANIPVAKGTAGSVILTAHNPTPGGGTGDEYEQAVVTPASATAAARILDQTTFGPTTALINHVQAEGITSWLAEQYATPQTTLPIIGDTFPAICGSAEMCLESEWWQEVLTGNDQLRQRVGMTLGEIFVVSSNVVPGEGMDYYSNMLAADAFTNWYTIMKDVTLSPAMGMYLNMLGSAAPPAGQIANENFARENMQLFNLGLSLLNQDGSLQTKGGQPIPTYSEAQVEAFARVYTGWTFATSNGSNPNAWNSNTPSYYYPLVAYEPGHDEGSKTLLNGTILPGGQTAEQDMAGALTNIFEHPNLPPFVCTQLIQHLVKSNPSPAYVSRVAAVFIDNGNGVRGDMKSVLTAIFTDQEARAGDTTPQSDDGHLREPILWLTAVMRGLGYVNIDPSNFYQYLSNYSGQLGEWPYASPSVFNFFSPEYIVPGTTLHAPEFALENTASAIDRISLADSLVKNSITGFNVDLSATSPLGLLASSPTNLVNALSKLFLHSQMDANTKAAIISEVSGISSLAQRVSIASYLVVTSSEYKVMN